MADKSSGDGLLRWLLGGLAAGAVVLGLLVAAYAIGHSRGEDKNGAAAPATTTEAPPATTEAPSPTPGTTSGDAARGKGLFASLGCAACHSVDGGAGAGPTVKGLAGLAVELADGSTATADAAYLTTAIADPDAQVVKGYSAGIMSAATTPLGLDGKPQQIADLVAFIESLK